MARKWAGPKMRCRENRQAIRASEALRGLTGPAGPVEQAPIVDAASVRLYAITVNVTKGDHGTVGALDDIASRFGLVRQPGDYDSRNRPGRKPRVEIIYTSAERENVQMAYAEFQTGKIGEIYISGSMRQIEGTVQAAPIPTEGFPLVPGSDVPETAEDIEVPDDTVDVDGVSTEQPEEIADGNDVGVVHGWHRVGDRPTETIEGVRDQVEFLALKAANDVLRAELTDVRAELRAVLEAARKAADPFGDAETVAVLQSQLAAERAENARLRATPPPLRPHEQSRIEKLCNAIRDFSEWLGTDGKPAPQPIFGWRERDEIVLTVEFFDFANEARMNVRDEVMRALAEAGLLASPKIERRRKVGPGQGRQIIRLLAKILDRTYSRFCTKRAYRSSRTGLSVRKSRTETAVHFGSADCWFATSTI